MVPPRTPRSSGPVLAICGSGNAGHALAVVASGNFDGHVDWLVGSSARAAVLQRGVEWGGLRSTGALEAAARRLRKISSDPADVIPGADIVMIVVPAFAHAAVLDRIEPHLDETAIVGCLPTRGGFEFEGSRFALGSSEERPRLVGLQTLPWSARIVRPGESVLFNAVKERVALAALPAHEGPELARLLSRILGTELVPTDGFLNLTLGNPGQFIHPGLMYGHFRFWRGEEFVGGDVPLFYADATNEMGEIVEGLSREATTVARTLEKHRPRALDLRGVVPVHEWLREAYPHATSDQSTVATCFRSGPLQMRRAPMTEIGTDRFVPDFEYRYLSEDIPYGLVVTRAVAEIAGVATPAIDEVIRWGQWRMDKEYLSADGSLTGCDVAGLPIPQNHGIATLDDLIAWYGQHPAAPLRRPSVAASL